MPDTTPTTADLPERLSAVLTERFTSLGNPFSEMRYNEQGPDGWPASHPVSPDMVAKVLRELMTDDPARLVLGTTDQQPETDEQRADREETERDHAVGDHTHCGVTCEVEMPTEHLRNFVIAKGYPGTKGALNELLRRAADQRPETTPAGRGRRIADGQGEPADLRDLPREVRLLVHAVDRMLSDWAESGDEWRADLWRGVHDASSAVWNRPLAVLPAPADRAAADAPVDRRARYAAAIREADGWVLDDGQHMVDAVMAVADAEQAALRAEVEGLDEALRGAISASEKDGARLRAEVERLRGLLWAKYGATPRRLADEAQQPTTAKAAPLATPCNICTHTLNWHRNEGGCSVHACYCRSWQQPTDVEAQQQPTS